MSPVRRHLIATTEHVMKTKWKLSGVIHKIVLVKLANGAKESGHHALQLVVLEQNKGRRKKNTLQFKQNLRQVDCYVNAGENSWVKVADDDAVDACYQNEKPSQTMTCKMTDCPNSRKYYTEGAGAKK